MEGQPDSFVPIDHWPQEFKERYFTMRDSFEHLSVEDKLYCLFDMYWNQGFDISTTVNNFMKGNDDG